MKTKLPKHYSNLSEFNYDVKLISGLFFALSSKFVNLNCKNYSILKKEEITIKTTCEFSFLTIKPPKSIRVQYLITNEYKIEEAQKIPDRFLPDDFKKCLNLAYKSICDYDCFPVKSIQLNAYTHSKT